MLVLFTGLIQLPDLMFFFPHLYKVFPAEVYFRIGTSSLTFFPPILAFECA